MKNLYQSINKRNWLAPALGVFALSTALLAAPTAHAQTTKYEAEDQANTLAGSGIVIENTITGASGNGYVNFNGNSGLSLSIPVTVATAGTYNLVVRYESQYGTTQAGYGKVGAYKVNNGPVNKLYFNGTAPGVPGVTFRSTSNLRVTLNAGANTVVILDNSYGYFGIDFISIAPVGTATALTPAATTGRIEAEAGQLTGTQAVLRDDDTAPRSGSLYVSSFAEGAAAGTAGSSISLPVNIATAGLYQIVVGARGQYDGKSFDVAVATATANGGKLNTVISAAGTNPSPNFAPFTVGKYNLTAGTNTITITSQTSYVDIDYVDITATSGVATAVRGSADAQRDLTVYPNPSHGQSLTVGLAAAAARTASVELVNALGQRVLTTTRSFATGDNTFTFPTTGVAPGLYQLVVRAANQPVLSHRVVVD